MAMFVLFSLAACGGEGESKDKTDAGSKAHAGNDTVKFDAEIYTVGVEEYITLKDHIVVEPADTAVKFSCSDETVVEVFSASKGEFMGVKTGEVTVTAGEATATCKLVVAGMGTIVHCDGNYGGITNRLFSATSSSMTITSFLDTKKSPLSVDKSDFFHGAADRGRTGTVSLPRDFKSLVSAYSTTAAYVLIVTKILYILNRRLSTVFSTLKIIKALLLLGL